jgi:hypothetical protein
VKHISDAPQILALALLANIGPGWKGLSRTNIPAYYEHSLITAVKCFIALLHLMSREKKHFFFNTDTLD